MAVHTYEPDSLVLGDFWTWQKSFSDYPAGDGWVLTYFFSNAGGSFELSAAADGDAFLVGETVTDPTAGSFTWRAFVEKDGTRFQVGQGTIEIQAAPDASSPLDLRTHAAKVVDAIEAVIEGRATKDQESYTIDGRSLSRTPIGDLMKMRDRYKDELAGQKTAEQFAKGRPGRRYIKTQFRSR